MLCKYIFSLTLHFLVNTIHHSVSQTGTNGCSQYFRNIHRMGPNIQGRLEIPTDDFYPKFKLKISFNSPIHHMAIRHSRAKDTGTHREFVIDPMEMRKDGKLHLDIFIRLNRLFGTMSRMTRIIYNNVALCGDPLGISELDESFVAEIATTTNHPITVPVLAPTNGTTQSWKIKDYGEEEEDIF